MPPLPSSAATRAATAGETCRLARGACTIVFVPSGSTMMLATPVPATGSIATARRSMPSRVERREKHAPELVVADAPRDDHLRARRRAATAWLKPLPPRCMRELALQRLACVGPPGARA